MPQSVLHYGDSQGTLEQAETQRLKAKSIGMANALAKSSEGKKSSQTGKRVLDFETDKE
ncbi:MAG: hypothetical protein WCE90_12955 [Candidatus Zixiibacteriota bacterium]